MRYIQRVTSGAFFGAIGDHDKINRGQLFDCQGRNSMDRNESLRRGDNGCRFLSMRMPVPWCGKGPRKRTEEDNEKFMESLERLLREERHNGQE